MNKFTIYCTQEQTQTAYNLGAPIGYKNTLDNRERGRFEIPTAEQMIGWIREQGLAFDTEWSWGEQVTIWVWDNHKKERVYTSDANSLKEATLAAIDEALDYLEKQNVEK